MQYRPELDGMRTVAVSLVLFFHFGFSSLSGGFIGVDVFFVISGFLITSIILNALESGTFSLVGFFEKRAKRLFPALFAMMFASCIAGYLLFMPDEFKEFGQSLIASSVYLSNMFFWLKSDYFSGPSELKPLLHTWSLAVEEQYYLLFPLLLLFINKYSLKTKAFIVFALLSISFAGGLVAMNIDKSFAFFFAPFRFWELMLGSMCAFAFASGLIRNTTETTKLASFASFLGLVAILFSGFTYNKSTEFPGIYAFLPAVGTALIVLFGAQSGVVKDVLGSSIFVYIGKISYSLYLWHWPVVVFYGYWMIEASSYLDKLIMLLLTLIFSLASYYLIEKPARHVNVSQLKTFTATATVSAFFIAVGLYIFSSDGAATRFPDIAKVEIYDDTAALDTSCFLTKDQNFIDWNPSKCFLDARGTEGTIALWGDSHANHYMPGLIALETSLKNSLLQFSSAGCPPILNVEVPGRPNCRASNTAFFDYLKTTEIRSVMLAASWTYAENVSGIELDELQKTIALLVQAGFEVTLINQVPVYSFTSPQYLAARLAQRAEPRSDFYMKPSSGSKQQNFISSRINGAKIINIAEFFCEDAKGCLVSRNGSMLVSDQAHLSSEGSKLAAQYIVARL